MDLRADPLEPAKQLRVVAERQVGMQAVDDVYFRQRLPVALTQLVPRLFERHRVRVGVARLETRERTEQAARDADVRRFDADVVVVEGAATVPFFALAIGEPGEREQIVGLEQPQPLGGGQAAAGVERVGDVEETGGVQAAVHVVPRRAATW
jgi:hypothetical protein